MSFISNIFFKVFKVLIPSVYFNFHYLPFRQALKLPIMLYNPKFKKMGGTIKIESDKLYRGLICLGKNYSKIWPNNGISWYNEGNVVFHGKANIGSNSYVVTKEKATIEFGDNFEASASLKLISTIGIKFGERVLIGWDNLLTDSDFHQLYNIEKHTHQKGYGKIDIGNDNWICAGCYILHSVHTPSKVIIAARSTVNKSYNQVFQSYCIHGGTPFRVIKRNIEKLSENDTIVIE